MNNGDKYIGEIDENNEYTGEGEYIYKSGRRYKGGFKNSHFEG